MSTKFSEPFANDDTATRRPLTRVSVDEVPSPRSDAAALPAGESACSAPEFEVLKLPVPPPVSDTCLSASPTVLAPSCLRSVLSNTTTGCASC